MRCNISSITDQIIFQIAFLAHFVTEFKGFGPFNKDLKCARGFQALKLISLAWEVL